MPRGKRESHWLVICRCLAIVRRAQRGPASRDELIRAVLAQEGADAYGNAQGNPLYRRLENDLRHIRYSLQVDLYFSRQEGGYVIRDTWLPLLDLPDEDLATVAWLEETFGMESPQHDEIHDLLGRLRLYLTMERRAEIERHRTALTVDLRQRDEDDIPPAVWDGLTKALTGRRRVEFDYLSPQYEDNLPRRHVVDSYERYFDAARGHYYLRGWCLVASGPEGQAGPGAYIYYRLGRISNLRVLPHKMPPFPPTAPRYPVVYELTPQVARLGVTRHPEIAIQEIERRVDGSALVRGETDNLFWAVQTLLHYGPNCRVLGGPEMVEKVRETVRAMAELYREE
jgi:predicted DNA-binding transcriptional regulator YafY